MAGGFDSKVYFNEPEGEGQVITSRYFMSRLSSGLNDLRAQKQFCDVIINIEDKQFPAHKVVLSAASDYFMAMFTSGFQESTSSEVRIDEGESESFEQLLNFAYTGSLNLSTETIRGVFQMACFMQTSEAIDICSSFLSEFFTYPKGSIGYDDIFLLWQLFDGQGMKKLAKACRKYMLQNFTGFSSSDAFLIYMTHHQMVEILEDEEIETEISGEAQVSFFLFGVVNSHIHLFVMFVFANWWGRLLAFSRSFYLCLQNVVDYIISRPTVCIY